MRVLFPYTQFKRENQEECIFEKNEVHAPSHPTLWRSPIGYGDQCRVPNLMQMLLTFTRFRPGSSTFEKSTTVDFPTCI